MEWQTHVVRETPDYKLLEFALLLDDLVKVKELPFSLVGVVCFAVNDTLVSLKVSEPI